MIFKKKKEVWPPKCDYCGRFISYKDLEEGVATFKMIYPDSAFTSESWEGCCKKCKLKFKK